MKKLLLLFLPFAALLAGCEKENDETHGQDSFNRLVKEVTCECWDWEGGDEKSVFEFKYDDKNRLCYVAEKRYNDKDQLYGDNVYRYAYELNELTILGDMNQENETSETHYSVTYTYRFENDLMISELREVGNSSEVASFYYDNAGLLSRMIEEYNWINHHVDLLVSWNNGNMVGPNVYSSYKNNANLDFSSLMWGDYDPKSDRHVFKGIHNENLVEKEKDGDYLLLYSYVFDQYGYPIKIEASDNKGWNSTKLYIQYYQ